MALSFLITQPLWGAPFTAFLTLISDSNRRECPAYPFKAPCKGDFTGGFEPPTIGFPRGSTKLSYSELVRLAGFEPATDEFCTLVALPD